MRPLSFTRNLGGFEKAYGAIRAGFVPGVTVKQFQERCGLGPNVSHLVTEFLLGAYIRDGEEFVLADSLIGGWRTQSWPFLPVSQMRVAPSFAFLLAKGGTARLPPPPTGICSTFLLQMQ
jgi:hypothetical protein